MNAERPARLLYPAAARLRRLRALWYRLRLLLAPRPGTARLSLGPGCAFNVPVSLDGGRGAVVIGARNVFGYHGAPRCGNGRILLHGRTEDAVIRIGEGNVFSNNVTLCAVERITVGRGCRIGDFVSILDSDFHEIDPRTRDRSPGRTAPVVIGDNVWIGSRAMVLKGVTLGDNAILGAMSVATRSVPPNCIAVGQPARVVRKLSSPPAGEGDG